MELLSPGFNSLQTGKWIQRKHKMFQAKFFSMFQFPSNGKVDSESVTEANGKHAGAFSFNSLQTGKWIQRDPILIPVGPWLRTPKTKRELREAFFASKFTPKTSQTHVGIDPNAIF